VAGAAHPHRCSVRLAKHELGLAGCRARMLSGEQKTKVGLLARGRHEEVFYHAIPLKINTLRSC